jgi:hypothetical protein
MRLAVALAAVFALMPCAAAEAPVTVMVVGVFHMDNPGHDMHNVAADDVLAPKRQTEIAAVAEALNRFKPTLVAVEWPADKADQRYGQYRAGTLPPNRDESVQIGFRLAAKAGLAHVAGIDVLTDFPYEAVDAYGKAHGQKAFLDGLWKDGQARVDAINATLTSHSIGATLHFLNEPERIARDHDFYRTMLRVGGGNEQPGVALLTAWYDRNFRICANLVQEAKPGDRVVVVYGAGHAFLLRQCFAEMPGYRLVEANDFLPQ